MMHSTTTRRSRMYVTTLLSFVAIACTASKDQTADVRHDAPEAMQNTARPADTAKGMSGAMEATGSTAVMTAMQQHVQILHTATPDSLRALLPAHRQMVANMIATLNTEMREMNMSGDAAWNATVDSLRADLVNMPSMQSQELKIFFPPHIQRVTHLMHMHQDMMAKMKM